jgi:hypothetical protein
LGQEKTTEQAVHQTISTNKKSFFRVAIVEEPSSVLIFIIHATHNQSESNIIGEILAGYV